MMNRSRQLLIYAALLTLFALTACTPESYETDQGRTVEVKLTEHRIDMPSSLEAGATTFKITNAGKAEHNFAVEGEGIDKELDANLEPGATGTLIVELKPGTYKVYCPVGNHEEKGMKMQLTVK
jgi:uncharacterized cupredoxin-like copper-binding protein